MINYPISVAILCFFVFTETINHSCTIEKTDFLGWEINFPSTVGDAVKMHKLDYKPPGFYYKNFNKNKSELIIDYIYIKSDFNNEYQPKETLFPRELNSYIFRFSERHGLRDSLKTILEKKYEKRFISKSGINPANSVNKQEWDFSFLEINSCMTVGITSSPASYSKRYVLVRFFYNVPERQRILEMRNFL